MGIYYSGISKRTYTVDGMTFAFSNFFGKEPPMFMFMEDARERRWKGNWDRFCTRAENTAEDMKGTVDYVVYAGKTTDLDGTCIAKWDGQALLHDGFWDKYAIGNIVKVGGRYRFVPSESEVHPMDAGPEPRMYSRVLADS